MLKTFYAMILNKQVLLEVQLIKIKLSYSADSLYLILIHCVIQLTLSDLFMALNWTLTCFDLCVYNKMSVYWNNLLSD